MQVQLCAVITQPTIAVSTDTLQFDTLQCGTCQVIAHSTNKTAVPEYVNIPYPCLQVQSDCALPGGVLLTPSFGSSFGQHPNPNLFVTLPLPNVKSALHH